MYGDIQFLITVYSAKYTVIHGNRENNYRVFQKKINFNTFLGIFTTLSKKKKKKSRKDNTVITVIFKKSR